LKKALGRSAGRSVPQGASVLIYHRVGGGSPDERDMTIEAFKEQIDALATHDVVHLDHAVDALERGDRKHQVVLTFDDGFADVYENAWPILRERRLPFTVYAATSYIGATMHWEGSTARDTGAPAMMWRQLAEMVDSGLCTVANHTHSHARPEALNEEELDWCTAEIRDKLGVTPRHFAYPWGVGVTRMEDHLRARFRSAATGQLGRNLPGHDLMRMNRIPVRGSDPIEFFRAKLTGRLWPERAYAVAVGAAKRAGARA
jgi:peptidoglycan/xylan/chitin deacetylase (PgdA/CDA1 family)